MHGFLTSSLVAQSIVLSGKREFYNRQFCTFLIVEISEWDILHGCWSTLSAQSHFANFFLQVSINMGIWLADCSNSSTGNNQHVNFPLHIIKIDSSACPLHTILSLLSLCDLFSSILGAIAFIFMAELEVLASAT